MSIKSIIRKLTPKFVNQFYHFVTTYVACIIFGFPSSKMIVIGVTGTNGKTSSCNLIAKTLENAGYRVGMATTANFKIADKEWINTTKQSMQGGFRLQKLLKQMLDAKCTHVIVETTSQGIEQYRTVGIDYDICVFTNLTPEHIEAHGGFENYKNAKLKLFKQLENREEKKINGNIIPRIVVANFDDVNVLSFINFKVDKIIGVSMNGENRNIFNYVHDDKFDFFIGENVKYDFYGSKFLVVNKNINDMLEIDLKLKGSFNIYNALLTFSVCYSLGMRFDDIKKGLFSIEDIPGRMQFIEASNGIVGVVDYAHDPNSIAGVYENIKNLLKLNNLNSKIIAVLGSCGGGRDIKSRFDKGNAAGALCDYVIVTNEDPYDDDIKVIIDDVFAGVVNRDNIKSDLVLKNIIRDDSNIKIESENVFRILDRREAINKAVQIANTGDVIVCTGKGAERSIVMADGKKIDWNEYEILKEEVEGKM